MALLLRDELRAAGFEQDPEEFRVLLMDLFHGLYRNWTDEELSFHPDDAKHFCNVVRDKIKCPMAPDYLILRTLSNMRKRSLVPKEKGVKTRGTARNGVAKAKS